MPPEGFPRDIRPMLATEREEVPGDPGWASEFKWDGMRVISLWDGRRLRLLSRNGRDVTSGFPDLSELGSGLRSPSVLDGEIIAPDDSGKPDFNLLLKRIHIREKRAEVVSGPIPIAYIVFDLLFLGEHSTMDLPYEERRRLLTDLAPVHPNVRVAPYHIDEGESMFKVAREHGMEGVVLKRLGSRYFPGIRSKEWVKVKLNRTADLVVGGWRPRSDNPSLIGSLLLGEYASEGSLHYVGSVGSGFGQDENRELKPLLGELESASNPFSDDVRGEVRFVKPELVIEVNYRRWPKVGNIQQASFSRISPFKDPTEVRHGAR